MGSLFKFIGIDRILSVLKILKEHGGIRAGLYKLYRMDDLKPGRLVGEDRYGNKYFENNRYFYGRNRWVEYAPKYGTDYDGSQIPAEWFGWMHYKTDLVPTNDPARPKHKWLATHLENPSGTRDQYMPYSTTPPKIEPWIPPKSG